MEQGHSDGALYCQLKASVEFCSMDPTVWCKLHRHNTQEYVHIKPWGDFVEQSGARDKTKYKYI